MTTAEKRIRAMLNRLALAPIRTCRTLHQCTFCAQPIRDGEKYRDKGYGARSHEFCFQAVRQEYR